MNEKKELSEQELKQVAGGSSGPTYTITYACDKCGSQKTITCTELPENPSCPTCGRLMIVLHGYTIE